MRLVRVNVLYHDLQIIVLFGGGGGGREGREYWAKQQTALRIHYLAIVANPIFHISDLVEALLKHHQDNIRTVQ